MPTEQSPYLGPTVEHLNLVFIIFMLYLIGMFITLLMCAVVYRAVGWTRWKIWWKCQVCRLRRNGGCICKGSELCMVPVNGSYHLVILLHCTTQAIYPLDLKNTVLAYLNKVVWICVQYVCVRGRFVAVLITYFLFICYSCCSCWILSERSLKLMCNFRSYEKRLTQMAKVSWPSTSICYISYSTVGIMKVWGFWPTIINPKPAWYLLSDTFGVLFRLSQAQKCLQINPKPFC